MQGLGGCLRPWHRIPHGARKISGAVQLGEVHYDALWLLTLWLSWTVWIGLALKCMGAYNAHAHPNLLTYKHTDTDRHT
eukprot:15432460-Alexandrium_andersonii.AAC.1